MSRQIVASIERDQLVWLDGVIRRHKLRSRSAGIRWVIDQLRSRI